MIQASNLSVSIRGTDILHSLHFSIEPGAWVMVVGPNGAGKTTLLYALSGILPYEGSLMLNDREIRTLSPATIGKTMAMVEQSIHLPFHYTVEQVVAMGRYVHRSGMFHPQGNGEVMIRHAMEMTDILPLRHRSILTLSGGEKQRVFLAQAMCQDPSILLLDEPVNHLDLQQQYQFFMMLQQWMKTPSRTVVLVMHDLSLALQFGTKFLVLDHGTLRYNGDKQGLLSGDLIDQIWKMDVRAWLRSQADGWKLS